MAFLPLPSPLSPGSFLLAKPGSIPSAATAAARSADAARLWEVLLQKAPPSPVVEVLLLGSWGSVHGVYFYLHWNAARSRRESTEMSWKWKHFSVRFNVPFWLRIAGAHVAPMRVLKIQFIIADVVNFIYTITPLSTHVWREPQQGDLSVRFAGFEQHRSPLMAVGCSGGCQGPSSCLGASQLPHAVVSPPEMLFELSW